jgi:thiol-disulfide isomerase/thioredoxin
MRACVRFAVFCLSVARAAVAANLVELKEPAKITGAFTANAPVRMINVWATWCVPCVEEMGDLATISNTFGTQLSLVGVSLDDMIPGDRAASKRKVNDFLDQKRITYTNIYYSGNGDALGEKLRFNGEIPITILYDRTGREVWRQQGRLDRAKASVEIKKMLGRKR